MSVVTLVLSELYLNDEMRDDALMLNLDRLLATLLRLLAQAAHRHRGGAALLAHDVSTRSWWYAIRHPPVIPGS